VLAAYVARPAIVHGAHKISTAEILDDIRAHHPDHPKLGVFLRAVANCGVSYRHFTRPLAMVTATRGVKERNRAAFDDSLDMAERAALQALEGTGLRPDDIDAIITSHTTSWQVPQLDIALMGRLGLRRDIHRLPLATLACAGGAQALILARNHLKTIPGGRILVVVAEDLSSIYHHSDAEIQHMAYKALFGCSAGAVIVTDAPTGPGFVLGDSFEHVLPEIDGIRRYWGRLDAEGLHFDSTRAAARAAADALPYLTEWMGGWRPDFAAIHTGGPGIIADVARALDLTPHDARHSVASLDESGNLGGVAVFDVLDRTLDDPPADGADGLLVAFGPGFVTAACKITARSS